MRFFDFLVALAGILLLFPLFLIIAILIKLSSPGPVIYSQRRIGLDGKVFSLYKFRSMIKNADQVGTSVTAKNDPRITPIGKILRKTKVDELPQLFNVLKGDMSFVGPRPDVPEIINTYTSEMRRILNVRPGITGNATLYLRNEENLLSLAKDPDKAYEEIFVPAKVKLSLEHVNRKSFWFDFSILMKTIWTLTGGKILPIKEHPVVREINEQIHRQNEGR